MCYNSRLTTWRKTITIINGKQVVLYILTIQNPFRRGGGDRTTQNVFLEIADILWIEVTHDKYSPAVMYSASTTRHWNGGFTQFHHVSVNCELCRVQERILRKTQPQRTNAYGLTFARGGGSECESTLGGCRVPAPHNAVVYGTFTKHAI